MNRFMSFQLHPFKPFNFLIHSASSFQSSNPLIIIFLPNSLKKITKITIDFQQFEVLSFDGYGTLINWENGILSALKKILFNHNIHLSDNEILELFAQQESMQESGDYLKYGDILKNVVHDFGKTFNFIPTELEANALAESIQTWEPFPDTVEALKALKTRYKLTMISNIDDELFAFSAKKLEVEFDCLSTALT